MPISLLKLCIILHRISDECINYKWSGINKVFKPEIESIKLKNKKMLEMHLLQYFFEY